MADRPGHDVKYAVNSKKVEKLLNIKIKNQFRKNLKDTVNWYLNNKEWCDNSMKTKYKLQIAKPNILRQRNVFFKRNMKVK